MRRGTTPTHTFTTDIDLSNATVVYLTYKQGSSTVITKTLDDMTVTDESITVELSQDDTLAFDTRNSISMQIRAKFADGSAIASNIMSADPQAILRDGVI